MNNSSTLGVFHFEQAEELRTLHNPQKENTRLYIYNVSFTVSSVIDSGLCTKPILWGKTPLSLQSHWRWNLQLLNVILPITTIYIYNNSILPLNLFTSLVADTLQPLPRPHPFFKLPDKPGATYPDRYDSPHIPSSGEGHVSSSNWGRPGKNLCQPGFSTTNYDAYPSTRMNP